MPPLEKFCFNKNKKIAIKSIKTDLKPKPIKNLKPKQKGNRHNVDLFVLLISLIIGTNCIAQNKIYGTLKNETSEKVENANVILKDFENSATLYFTKTDENGHFLLNGKISHKKYIVKITSLGFQAIEKEIEITSPITDLGEIIFKKNTIDLEEVVLEAKRKAITISGDTTKYNIDYFKNGTEDNLKDLLNNLPGIDTNDKGKIVVNGKEITELLIDGENLYKRQHQLATENISAKAVKSIELYKNHSAFEKLKTDEKTEATALNVLIKDEFKNKLKGFIQADSNFEDRYKINSSVYNFNKKNKFSLIQNSNNLGKNPIGIEDYFSITQVEEENLTHKSSNVIYATANDIPRFLIVDENAIKKNSNFLNISNVYSPTKKTKINFYSILNFANLEEFNFTQQKFINSNLEFNESKNVDEKSLFGMFNLKGIHKYDENTVFKFTNSLILDNVKNNNDLNNFSIFNPASLYENSNSKKKNFNSTFNFAKKIKKSLLFTNAFLNFAEVDFKNQIVSDHPFLNFDFEDNYDFKQFSKKIDKKIGFDASYSFNIKNLGIDLKTAYTQNLYYFNNYSNTNLEYSNFYQTKSNQALNEIGFSYNISKKVNLRCNFNYNQVNQNVNNFENYNTNFLGYSSSIKFSFNSNSVLQLSNTFSNELASPENLIENYYVKDYRTLFGNFNVRPNTLLPFNNFNFNYFKFNIKSNATFILNFNHMYSNKAINTNLRNEANFSISEYGISPKNEMTIAMLFFEKKLEKIPFNFNFNLDFNQTEKEFYIDSDLSFYKSTYYSNSLNLKSAFKKSPIHFNIGYNYASTNFNNNNTESRIITFQGFLNMNGQVFKDFYWRLNSSNTSFKTDDSKRNLFQMSPNLRYSKSNSNWEYYVEGHNIFNLKNPEILTNLSGPGYTLQTVTGTLNGYVNFGTKYKF